MECTDSTTEKVIAFATQAPTEHRTEPEMGNPDVGKLKQSSENADTSIPDPRLGHTKVE